MSEHMWIRSYNFTDRGMHRVGCVNYFYEAGDLFFFSLSAKSKRDTFNAEQAKIIAKDREFLYCLNIQPHDTEHHILAELDRILLEDACVKYLARTYNLVTSGLHLTFVRDLAHSAYTSHPRRPRSVKGANRG